MKMNFDTFLMLALVLMVGIGTYIEWQAYREKKGIV